MVDPEYLRHHYASLSDEALLEIKRTDLVEAAQKCLDGELHKRALGPARIVGSKPLGATGSRPSGPEETRNWLEEAAEAFSRYDFPGVAPADDVLNARQVLEAAGIPCHLEFLQEPEEKVVSPGFTHRWRIMVPGKFNMRAASVLERDIFNAEFEAQWKTLLETFSDEELRAMAPRMVFCGLFDRIERANRSYDAELERRGVK
jgi:hypothetical protein